MPDDIEDEDDDNETAAEAEARRRLYYQELQDEAVRSKSGSLLAVIVDRLSDQDERIAELEAFAEHARPAVARTLRTGFVSFKKRAKP